MGVVGFGEVGREKREGIAIRTDVGCNAGEDDLAFILSLDGGFEFGVVPGVYFAVALNERCVGVEAEDFLW